MQLKNASKRTVVFNHAGFFAAIAAGVQVLVPAPYESAVRSEVERMTKEGQNKDAENPVFFECVEDPEPVPEKVSAPPPKVPATPKPQGLKTFAQPPGTPPPPPPPPTVPGGEQTPAADPVVKVETKT